MAAQLAGGKIDEKNRLFSAAQGREMWGGVTIVPVGPAINFGMG